ncbi:respiratory-chain NADH dehydrogenase subunit 1 [Candidatus Moduliflexus flocculans]|uniref:Respiratory-chain NADH dehydrogenase subunit 1 n=1 Tax=Candidatus Moduliflexus flocculans TaxID=1499966 RepID=A0A0S6VV94_9BACT|nr:respiratory-chain NADH dehydrogenase subunit 1 [Candidatus Moduliflexus flocculans]
METITVLDAIGKIGITLFIVPVIGALIMGLDRKITARIQGRYGPPILQPIYDIIKLFQKESVILNFSQIIYAYLHLAFMMLAVLFIVLGQDLLMVLFVLAFSTLSLILGGMSVYSPYSRIGSQREIIQLVSYEPILVLMVIGIYLRNSSFMVKDLTVTGKPLLFSLPLIFMSFFIAMTIKLQKSPFDFATSHHAHQEIVKGVTIEYSGKYLGIIEITHCYEVVLVMAFVVMFWATNVWIGTLLAIICYFLEIIVDNAFARLRTMWMFRYMWTVAFILSLTNLIWLYLWKS